jgi:hypothetical protein
MTIAVDFDGVIHSYERGWADGSIYGDFVPGAMVALMRLLDEDAVFVHTTRSPGQVARWIERTSGHTIECTTRVSLLPWRRSFWSTRGLLLVTRRKLPAVAYIDDRAIHFTTWDEALRVLHEREPARECAGADFSRLMKHIAESTVAHADRDRLVGVRRSVFLARGGHAPGDVCPTEKPADPHEYWCASPDDECNCPAGRVQP